MAASRRWHVVVDPGPMLPSRVEFAGNAGISATRLHEAALAVGTLTAWIDPASFARAIQSLYRDEGFLAAQVDVAPPEISQGTSVVQVDVREGRTIPRRRGPPRAAATPSRSRTCARRSGSPRRCHTARPSIAEALGRIDRRLRRAGFLASRTTVEAVVRQPAARVDLRVDRGCRPAVDPAGRRRRGRRCGQAARRARHRADTGRAHRSAGAGS